MKFSHHLLTHRTPEWEKQYIRYGVLKTMLTAGERGGHWNEDAESSHRHRRVAQDGFFQACDRELVKVNCFYSEKLTEAHRRICSVKEVVQAMPERCGDGAECGTPWKPGGLLQVYRLSRRRQAEQELRRAIRDTHHSLVLLQNYQELNYTAFCKIMKKHDTSFTSTWGMKWKNEKLDISPLHCNLKTNVMIAELESLMCHLTGGDRSEAMQSLQMQYVVGTQPVPVDTAFRLGMTCGLVLALLVTIIIQASQASEWTTLRPFLQLYRGGFLLIQFIFLLGVNMYIWKKAGINYVLIFELDPRDHLSNQHLFEIAGSLALFWGISFLACLNASLLPVPLQLQPLVFYSLTILLLLNPMPTFHSSARRWLLTVLCRLLSTPFHPVTFTESWLADQLNSLSPLLLDLWDLIWFYISEVDWGDPSTLHSPPIGYAQDRLTCLIQCLPPWLRFAQCLRKFWDSGEAAPHLLNAGKYSTVFIMVAFAGLYGLARERPHLMGVRTYLYLWAVATCLSVVVTVTWDLMMDWGLLKGYGLLREEMVFRPQAFYYSAMLGDIILRISWALNIILAQLGNTDSVATVSTVLAPLEIFRRFMWNIFRLEYEHLKNCSHLRAVPDLHLTPLTLNSQSILESIMDREDHAKDHGKYLKAKRKANLALFCQRTQSKQTEVSVLHAEEGRVSV